VTAHIELVRDVSVGYIVNLKTLKNAGEQSERRWEDI